MRLAILAVSLFATDALAGPCSIGEGTSMVISARDIELPADGGIIVASTSFNHSSVGSAADAMNPSWRFRTADSTEHKPAMIRLAPGLVSYRPPAEATGALLLTAGTTSLHAVKRTTTEEPTLAAPTVFRVRAKATKGTPMRPGTLTVYVDLKAKPPKDAFALVLYAVAKDGTTTARSWGIASDDSKSFNVYQSPDRCEPRIPGMDGVSAGEKVQVAYVDTKGRLSAVSKTITVQRGR